MGSGRNPSVKPDLFSAQQSPDTPSLSASEPKSLPLHTDEPATASASSYALPTNLPRALRHLDDDQLDRLLAAVHAERQARRGKKLPVSDETLCVPRTSSVLIRRRNRLTLAHHDLATMFRTGHLGRAIQVEEPT